MRRSSEIGRAAASWRRHTAGSGALTPILLLSMMLSADTAHGQTTKQRWQHVALDAQHPMVVEVGGMIARLRVVGPRMPPLSEVMIVHPRSGNRIGGARITPDRVLLVDHGLIELTRRAVKRGEQNVLLAFVLAHELMHLAEKSRPAARASITPEEKALREQNADAGAVHMVALASYDLDQLLAQLPLFLTLVDGHDGTTHAGDALHGERMRVVERQIKEIRDGVVLFRTGLRLYEIGRYRDAIKVFTEYAVEFDAPEVQHALGLAALQQVIYDLQNTLPVDHPSAGFVPKCWPLVIPQRSARAQPTHHTLPVTGYDDLAELLRDARSALDRAGDLYVWHPDVHIALALVEVLTPRGGGAPGRGTRIDAANVELDRADGSKLPGQHRAMSFAERARLAVARASLALFRGAAERSRDLLAEANTLEGAEAFTACLECALQSRSDCARMQPPPLSAVSTPLTSRLPPVALGARIDDVETALGIELGKLKDKQVAVDAGELMVLYVPSSIDPARPPLDLVFLNGRLWILAVLWGGEAPCISWPGARNVDQLGGARARMNDRAGRGQQCIGDEQMIEYLFEPFVQHESTP